VALIAWQAVAFDWCPPPVELLFSDVLGGDPDGDPGAFSNTSRQPSSPSDCSTTARRRRTTSPVMVMARRPRRRTSSAPLPGAVRAIQGYVGAGLGRPGKLTADAPGAGDERSGQPGKRI
jgi:hypothetical protein